MGWLVGNGAGTPTTRHNLREVADTSGQGHRHWRAAVIGGAITQLRPVINTPAIGFAIIANAAAGGIIRYNLRKAADASGQGN
jgi:hypothetical protein